MGVRVTSQEDRVALFDSVTGFAFGPTFESEDRAERFAAFCGDGIRTMTDPELEEALTEFRESQAARFGEVLEDVD